MKNLFISPFLICCLSFLLLVATDTSSGAAKALPPVSEETEICIECHINYSPGIVEDWLKSRHAAVTPEDAMKKPAMERRVSAETFADSLKSVAVGCYECHSLNTDKHQDSFEHAGSDINIVVSPLHPQ